MTKNSRYYSRKTRGNMLCIVTSVFAGILLVVTFFSLKFTRVLGSYWEQRTKIEAASLAVAKDLGRIVIEDPYYGFVSLSDYPPTGKATMAVDNYYLPVQSINTILATVRLDMIIADQLNNPLMMQYAERDYQYAIAAKDRLMDELQRVTQPGASGKDLDGNTVTPYEDAVAAYESNSIRLTGEPTVLVPNSLKLTLGYEDGLSTNVHVPQPSDFAYVTDVQQKNGFYRGYVNAPYGEKNFVFAPLDNNISLVDVKKFRTQLNGLPYAFPTVILCQADQRFTEKDSKTRIVHAAAAARPACLIDKRPCPGALAISFPNGAIPEFGRLVDVFANYQVLKSPTDEIQSPMAGDYPPAPVSDVSLPLISSGHPSFGKVLGVALYDWIRRCGPNLDISALFGAFNQPFDSRVPQATPHTVLLQANRNGTIDCTSMPLLPDTSTPISHKQYRAVAGLAVYSTNKKYYDIFVKDYVFQPGRMQGGIHAGEPLGVDPDKTPPEKGPKKAIDEATYISEFPQGPAGGAVRPTYQQTGLAVEIRFRAR
jgi:hypothetical protein